MDRTEIDQVRRFNRTVTERLGVLHDHYLGQDRPVGEARLLWEIGEQGQDVRRLRERLGLDSGYVSRLLRSLETDGLVTVEPQPRDKRVRTVRLTDAGRAERAALDRRSDELAGRLLEPLNTGRRTRLVAAMAEVDRLLTAATVALDGVDPDHPDGRHCLRSYFTELQERFEAGFDPARSLLPDAGELRPPHGLFLVARLHGEPVGCAGLKLPPGAPAEVKRMWVAPRARGLGLGRRFLAELEAEAARRGFDVLHLDTNRALGAAIGLYRSYGFEEVAAFNDEPYAHHWFEKRITTASSE
ncbi:MULTISPECIES: bifunctional helix-turn-helix transcriptional regulator/GNAT family N-acetyltransferase [Streptomyces]|uniref:bifunctional helix-turn-helix transcriptional regulator/GNAT family N-acetyltransferase n=1 Tax=Streptomyces scabiei TaxID=1930 RepID=UPI0004E6682D|nr:MULTISPECIES: helix-turn-helix domain-containing GNAT family N-acetyltransferase [Streptomyces]MBP5909591.1 MarR family transcriptional regulator [Streptomyces sp. LBUM 1478]MBP5927387.1 MarR family transcriptional regulator [Streptomyces sp. LBUM 1479]KFG07983.1 MarR family transcriptional regulator [Streptomyces scabiei]MBP5889858.1 MarR family transcriptional regulator [Streptomyces sp. LBUM 1481]MBP5919894.1 MarR family transcriptional regulator [Streptomyces sp. LBUM 1483]